VVRSGLERINRALMSRSDLVDFWCFLVKTMSPPCLIYVGSVRCGFGLFGSKEPFFCLLCFSAGLEHDMFLLALDVDVFVTP
jgi:hypothetical protein